MMVSFPSRLGLYWPLNPTKKKKVLFLDYNAICRLLKVEGISLIGVFGFTVLVIF